MRKLEECKAYFQDVFMDYLQDQDNKIEEARYRQIYNTLEWIYGEEFRKVETFWRHETLNEFYKMLSNQ